MSVGAVIVAAGSGVRAGEGQPKQFRPLLGRTVLAWAVEPFARHAQVGAIVVVGPAGDVDALPAALGELADQCDVVPGGETRTAAVRAGLAALDAANVTHVLIHDAARPGVTGALIDRVLAGLLDADGAVPALPVADALKRVDGAHAVVDDVDRTGLMAVQTPQGFRFGPLQEAYAALPANAALHDDVAVARAAGLRVRAVEGDADAFKITFPADFARARRVLGDGSEAARTTGRRGVGTGFDAHRLVPGDGVTLGGVFIPGAMALSGHSDADVALHALADALLGALGEGDIGEHFPPSDPQWKGADSRRFLAHAAALARSAGAEIEHIDMTVICERPRLKPHKGAMRAAIAQTLGVSANRVSVKATTTEGMGFTGRGEGIAAQAVAAVRFST